MKVLCDVCRGETAVVYCCADEAALCAPCDSRIHRANKLAIKHRRFSLLDPASPQQFPCCDICQEKRALLFCQEDRAILCSDCDAPIHSANDFTRKHSRFLLTGIKLSPFASTPSGTATSNSTSSLPVPSTISFSEEPPGEAKAPTKKRKKLPERLAPVATKRLTAENNKASVGMGASSGDNCTANTLGTSSISEYLINELPGWHLEDLVLDAASATQSTTFPLSKMVGDDLMPFLEADLDAAAFSAFDASNNSAWWVPQVPQDSLPPLPQVFTQQPQHCLGADSSKPAARQIHQQPSPWASDDCFTVPEIGNTAQHNPASSKRLVRTVWCIST